MGKDKKILCRFAAIMLLSMLLFTTTACSAPDNQRTREIAEPLIEESLKLDKILYGEGLSTTEEGRDGKYVKVTDERFKTVEDIRVACGKIYTTGLCQVVENSVLTGKGTEHGNIYARYIDRKGELYMYEGYEANTALADRYDYSSINTKDATDRRIIFTIDRYTKDSDTPMQIEITLLWSASGQCWQLDSPTY